MSWLFIVQHKIEFVYVTKLIYFLYYHNYCFFCLQNTVWFIFAFIFIALVIYSIRLVIFLKRRKKQAIKNTIERESFEHDQPKAI